MGAIWGSAVREGFYRGHAGLVYDEGPSTFDDLVAGTSAWTDRTFLVHGERRITFAEFRIAVRAARTHLEALGIGPGDRVMVFGYNSAEWVVALWALWLAGAVPVLANRWWSPAEIAHAVGLLAPAHLLTDSDLGLAVPSTALADLRGAADPGPLPAVATDLDAPALILFTSGSSGMPKAVELSRRSVICNQHDILARTGRLPHLLTKDSTQVVSLATTPMFHVGGLTSLLTHFLTGGKIVMAEGRFDAGEILVLIERERIQVWGAVPTMAVRILSHPDFDRYDLSSLKSWPLGGAPVTTALLDRIRTRLPKLRERGLSNTWGMTEAGGFLTVADARNLTLHPGTVGRPYPVVEIRIADADPDGVGEVLARSPTVMNGYVGVDESVVDADGWLHTGDLGHLTEDGHLFIDGRSKDIVIRGGENIACPHVEAALATHPAVVEVATLGIAHPDLGEELVAVVVHRSDADPPTPAALIAHVTGVLSYFAIPTQWEIRLEPLPTLAGEKVDKKSLARSFARAEVGPPTHTPYGYTLEG